MRLVRKILKETCFLSILCVVSLLVSNWIVEILMVPHIGRGKESVVAPFFVVLYGIFSFVYGIVATYFLKSIYAVLLGILFVGLIYFSATVILSYSIPLSINVTSLGVLVLMVTFICVFLIKYFFVIVVKALNIHFE